MLLAARTTRCSGSRCSTVVSAAASPAGDPVQRARQKMGYKNKWHRNNVETRQVAWAQPLSPADTIAIIGGGVAGLSCAQGLVQQGMRAVVFDTGEHGVGGRLATRTTADRSVHADWLPSSDLQEAGLLFDHAAQCFTATEPAFKEQCDAWEAAGVVQRWRSSAVGVLRPGGRFEPLPDTAAVYVAVGGMRQLAAHMARSLQPPVSVWVAKMAAAPNAGGWRLSGAGKDLGTYGAVVASHNGKCLNRLVGPVGAPDLARQVMRLRLSAVWVLMVAFEGPVAVPDGMEGAFVQDSPVLSWVGNNTAKLQLRHPPPHAGMQCWTLISTNAYGQANKVPQERVPADVAAKVTDEMLQALQQLLGPDAAGTPLPKPVFTRAQLWGAALPLNTPRVPCILDPAARVGVCGDWLLGASLQSAWLSGHALADRLAALRGRSQAEAAELAVGLTEPFVPLAEAAGAAGAEIGEFRGCSVPSGGGGQQPNRRQGGGGRSGGGGGRGGRGQQQRQPAAAASV